MTRDADRAGDRGAHAQRHHIAQGRRIEVGAHVHRVEQIFDRPSRRRTGSTRRAAAPRAFGSGGSRRRRRGPARSGPCCPPSPRRPRRGRSASRRRRSSAIADRGGAGRALPPCSRPASAKMRSSTRGTVRMVGPMSKRKPPSCSTAALPPTQPFLSNTDRAMTARGEHAGGGKAAEPAADHRNRLGLGHTLLTGPARRPSWSAPTRRSWRLAGSARPAGRHRSRSRTVRSAGRTSCRAGRCR